MGPHDWLARVSDTVCLLELVSVGSRGWLKLKFLACSRFMFGEISEDHSPPGSSTTAAYASGAGLA